jgi:hypothetical protein
VVNLPAESTPRAPDRRRLIGVIVVVLVFLAGSIAYLFLLYAASNPGATAAGPGSPSLIEVLPSHGTRSSCIVGTPGVPRPVLPLANGTFQANTYSVPNGTAGHVGMCYDEGAGSLFAYANWSHVGGSGGWFSYPQVTYGVDNWDGARSTYTNQSPSWILPEEVSQVADQDVWTVVNYSFHAPPSTDTDGYDFSLDDFFTESLPPVFEHGPFVEVMVWFAHHITYPPEFSSWSAPTLVNSTVSDQPWAVGDWCHGTDNSTNANVSFDYSYDGQGSAGLASGTIGVNLSLILADVEERMTSVSCWTGPTNGFSKFYLDEANLGSEDGALGGTSYNYNWTVSSYCFDTGVTNPTAANLSCTSGLAERLALGSHPAARRDAVPDPSSLPMSWETPIVMRDQRG